MQNQSGRKPAPNSVQMSNIRRIEWQKELIKRDVWQCCLNCEEWADGSAEHNGNIGCSLHKAMPPIEVFIVGCDDHMTDIPF